MEPAGLVPSDETALVIATRLPAALEALRVEGVLHARAGLPAHITLLYPFAQRAALDGDLFAIVARTVGTHRPFAIHLVEGRRWPDTVYVAVEPEHPLRALQAGLAAAFPTLPLYGGTFRFTPHVSIAEDAGHAAASILTDPAWGTLPVTVQATFVDLFVRDGDRWQRQRRFPLGGGTIAGA